MMMKVFPIACAILVNGSGVLAQGEPLLVSDSELPQGGGLAVALGGDSRLAASDQVIFFEDFSAGDFESRWDEVRNARILSLHQDADSAKGQYLQVRAELGKNTGGGMTKWFESSDRLFIRFYTRFDGSADYIHHFVTLRANRGLTGGDRWSGFGGAGVKPEGNERFSTALEPWGNWGRWPAPGRWNFYSYWHEMKPSPDGKYWGNGFRVDDQSNIPKRKWICAEFMLKHNTPGESDGEQAFWIDGKLIGHWKGYSWRTDAHLKANALTLESYVTDRWTKNRVNIVDFDQVVIATEYVGP